MNQSLINEIRALEIQIRVQMNNIPEGERQEEVTQLLLARSNCLNAIAVLVAANKR